MENIFLTSLTLPEVKQMFRAELEQFFAQKTKDPKTAAPEDSLLTIQEAAKFLKLQVATIYGLVSAAKIPYMKKGKRLYFSKDELMTWLKEGSRKTSAQIQASI